jgi:hypothetical protein
MKHFLTIPQRVIIERGFNIGVVDAVIMDALIFIGTSPKSKRKEVDGEVYFWASYRALEALLPLIGGMHRKSWRARFIGLEKAGLIKVKSDENSRCAATYVAFGPRYDEYVASDDWNNERDAVDEEEAKNVQPTADTCYPKVTDLLPKSNTPCYPKVTPLLPLGNTKVRKEVKEKEVKEEEKGTRSARRCVRAELERSASLAFGQHGLSVDGLEADGAVGKEKKKGAARGAAWTLDDVRAELAREEDAERLSECFQTCERAWLDWLNYKKAEKRTTYKRAQTFAMQVKRLSRECNYDAALIAKSIERSMANAWQGLFAVDSAVAQAEPYSYEARPAGAQNVETLKSELRTFYKSHQEAWAEVRDWLDEHGYEQKSDVIAKVIDDFCSARIAAGRFSDTFAQHHAALFMKVKKSAESGIIQKKLKQAKHGTDVNPLKY